MKADEWLYLCVAHGTAGAGAIEVRLFYCAAPVLLIDVTVSILFNYAAIMLCDRLHRPYT